MMEMTWLTLWNLTDETPENSKRFLDGGGMYLFLKVNFSPLKIIDRIAVSAKYILI